MKITIKNTGPIQNVEFHLKPLTIFIGENQQGKSQAIHIAAAMLDTFGLEAFIDDYINNPLVKKIPVIEDVYNELLTKKHVIIDYHKFIQENATKYLTALGKLTPSKIDTILGYETQYKKATVKFTLEETDWKLLQDKLTIISIRNIDDKFAIKTIKEKGDRNLHIYTDKDITIPKPAIMYNILNILYGGMNQLLNGKVYLFPSERAGFTLLSSEIQKLDIKVEPTFNLTPKKILPIALANYMSILHNILLFGSVNQRKILQKSFAEPIDYDYLNTLFCKVSGDKIYLSTSEPQFPRRIQISSGKTETDVLAASSGVKSLIGISLYIQYLAQKNDLIVIDEPEQNLHPTQQAKFIEFLAILVNNGIRVAITTHSPYIIEHLENLIQAYDLTDTSSIVTQLYFKEKMSLLNKKDTGIYLFQNGTAVNILQNNGTINWQTFCDTANDIANVTSSIYSAKAEENESSDNTNIPVTDDETGKNTSSK